VWEMSQGVLHLSCKARCRNIINSKKLLQDSAHSVEVIASLTGIKKKNITFDLRNRNAFDDLPDPEIAL